MLQGEKARVALAMFSLTPHNVLLLDEPSNHLDVATLEVLTEALQRFEGAIVVVSHDRRFLESLSATHVAVVKDGACVYEERALRPQDWEDDDMTHNAASATQATENTRSPQAIEATKAQV
jgi:ATPase subunit of ABC transporter with duplicated ATPase domains